MLLNAYFSLKAILFNNVLGKITFPNMFLIFLGYTKGDFKKVLPKKRTIRELNLEKVVNKLHVSSFSSSKT